jgi:hypothetical protein
VCKELCFVQLGEVFALGTSWMPQHLKEVEGRSSFPTAPFSAEVSEKSPRANSSSCLRTWHSMIRISSN